ncbi:helix-turn-helix domain-containing protein [Maribacter sp. 2307ULW6-5]|uniref:helix-turn-helix domain-containing protein n=1 Tax=Maribacter sp. 2307ULW6-5 TaxID=3386275 RepID=UPI0039BD9033
MNTIDLTSPNIRHIFAQLQKHLGGTLEQDPDEFCLSVDNDRARGQIKGVNLKNNFVFVEYDITFSQDTAIIRYGGATKPIYFLYCAKGQLQHSFDVGGKKRLLQQFQTGIFSSSTGHGSVLSFRKDNAVRGTVITVATAGGPTQDSSSDILRERLVHHFMPKAPTETFHYIGSYNLKISEQLYALQTIQQTGLVRNLLVKGILHILLALEIEQHQEDRENAGRLGTLTHDELDMIRELSHFIKNFPDQRFSIQMLGKKSGLSPAKLQEGFKFLHGMTVTNYIRKIRVEYAEKLIKTTDLNITEIVYSVGLTSRSYFSKIFKDKYNCSPKRYQDNQQRAMVND